MDENVNALSKNSPSLEEIEHQENLLNKKQETVTMNLEGLQDENIVLVKEEIVHAIEEENFSIVTSERVGTLVSDQHVSVVPNTSDNVTINMEKGVINPEVIITKDEDALNTCMDDVSDTSMNVLNFQKECSSKPYIPDVETPSGEKPSMIGDYLSFNSFEHFNEFFSAYKLDSMTSFCTLSNTRNFSKECKS